jgi:enterochelin esterase family protein
VQHATQAATELDLDLHARPSYHRPVRRGTIEMLRVESSSLAANPLGDPAVREIPIWLPPAAAGRVKTRLPVLYFLAGYTGGGRSWLNFVPFGENLAERMDRLCAAGMPPVIAVMPDCYTRLGGSQYVNSPAIGAYENHLVHELVPLVDQRFATSGARGLIGKSSGGYGALVLAMRHPELFAAVACHAGDMYFEWSYKPALPALALALTRTGGVVPWLEATLARPKRSGQDIGNLSTLCACAAYLPDASWPLGIRLPFDLQTGALDEGAWREFCEHDPVTLAPRHQAALASLKLLFFDAGNRDEHNLQLGARVLAATLQKLGVPFEHEEFADGHRDTAYRYDVSIPRLVQALA